MQIVTGSGPLFPDTLALGDCLEVMRRIPDGSVDCILTDPPYGTTAAPWDSVIPFDAMWQECNRVIKPGRAIVLFCTQPFTTALIASNLRNYKYSWVWVKNRTTGFNNAKNRPLKAKEDIAVFNTTSYNPQGAIPFGKSVHNSIDKLTHMRCPTAQNGGAYKTLSYVREFTNYPNNLLYFNCVSKPIHNTQKPVKLCEYLIKTYTNPGELVLDITAGSMTTAAAATRCGRRYICIEKDITYFMKGADRVRAAERERQVSGGAV